MTALSTNPGILIERSILTSGGGECWVCSHFTPFEVTIVTSRGWRRLPCCSVGCYQHLPGEYERFVAMQSNDCMSYY